MDVWNIVNYLQCEQVALKEKYDRLISLVGNILEAVKNEEFKRLENRNKNCQSKCRYYNRGYCKEGRGCEFFHPSEEVCQEYCNFGSCSQGRSCRQRHFKRCRYWLKGNCWRDKTCVYLHKQEDFEKDKDEDETDDDNAKDQHEEFSPYLTTDFPGEISTDEIIKMYENVEINLTMMKFR